ncbi:MAG: tripartite tricarboxylate transporter substrate binding protein [Burkholderiales bacterium]|nr:tripartite tricarboxylate transporter substrate binding protein [Burkholderiales bacterium]
MNRDELDTRPPAPRAPRRRTLRGLAAMGAAVMLPGTARAQPAPFPSRPVRIVVPQAPGGASDALARVMAARLGERWGQNVVVENRAGAGGNVGTEAVAKAPADGHVLLMGYAGTNSINPALYAKPGWEPKDLVGVATLAAVPFALVVNPQLGVSNVEQFVAAARAKADAIGYGSAGNGSVNHLLGVMFGAAAGVQMLHVPYKGAAPAITDLIGGQVQAVFTSLPSVAGFIQRGQLRALAVTSPARSPAFPDLPTLGESGVRGMEVSPWFGLLAPAATPAATVARINADVNALLAMADVRERFAASGADVLSGSPERFAELLREDLARWARVVRQSGAQVV